MKEFWQRPIRPMTSYRLTLEVIEDGRVIRKMEELRDKLEQDSSDGERTIGMLLSMVPAWAAADHVAGCGLATLGAMCYYLPGSDEDVGLFKLLGTAYEKWGASHDFASCVKIVLDRERLECDCVECGHPE